MYVVYKESDGFETAETVNVNHDLSAEVAIPNELEISEISVYYGTTK